MTGWDHFDGRRFFNPDARRLHRFRDLLRWQFTSKPTAWPDQLPRPQLESTPGTLQPGQVLVTFLHHASFLIRTHQVTLLTDPVWSARVGPWSLLGPHRVRDPVLEIEQLPPIDFTLVSHNHYDHMDRSTLKWLTQGRATTLVTPLVNGNYLARRGVGPAVELDWWQTHRDPRVMLHCVPAQHWSNRARILRNRALWGGFVIQTEGKTIYFSGDTGYWDRLFRELAQRFAPIDLALLPIGAYEPRWFMQQNHMNPDDAVRAHRALQAARSWGMHHGMWQLTDEAIDAPLEALAEARTRHEVPAEQFAAAQPGQSLLLT